MAMLSKSLYNDYSHDRKAVASVISKHKLAMVGIRCIDTDETAKDVLLGMQFEKFCKLIPDYVSDDLSLLFAK